MRILIVDDERDLAELLARRLTLEGHDAYVCNDGWTAIEMATLVKPDAVLTDLAMPGMDGWQLALRLRESLRSEAPLIIAVSAYQNGEHFARSRSAGIDFHLAKPRYYDQLHEILDRFAANRAPSASRASAKGGSPARDTSADSFNPRRDKAATR